MINTASLLIAYAKNEKDDLSKQEIKQLRYVVECAMTKATAKTTKNIKTKNNSEKMNKFGQKILDSLHETLDFIKGNRSDGRLTIMAGDRAIDIRHIRKELGMTRE